MKYLIALLLSSQLLAECTDHCTRQVNQCMDCCDPDDKQCQGYCEGEYNDCLENGVTEETEE